MSHDEARLRVAERSWTLQGDAGAEAASLEERLARLEAELQGLEGRLLDPGRLSVRERRRLEARRRELFDELSLCYDARLPPALPPYYALEQGVEVTAEPAADGVVFHSESGVQALLRLYPTGIGHLTLQAAADRMPLTWALEAAIRAIARLSFERLGALVLQLQTGTDLSALGFVDGGEGWWVLSRARYERLQGFLPGGEKRKRPL